MRLSPSQSRFWLTTLRGETISSFQVPKLYGIKAWRRKSLRSTSRVCKEAMYALGTSKWRSRQKRRKQTIYFAFYILSRRESDSFYSIGTARKRRNRNACKISNWTHCTKHTSTQTINYVFAMGMEICSARIQLSIAPDWIKNIKIVGAHNSYSGSHESQFTGHFDKVLCPWWWGAASSATLCHPPGMRTVTWFWKEFQTPRHKSGGVHNALHSRSKKD